MADNDRDKDEDTTLDTSEALDQLDPEQSLVTRGVSDPLDEGVIAPDEWSGGMKEQLAGAGEEVRERIKQEEPERDRFAEPNWDGKGADERDYRRAGRLVDANGGYDAEDDEASMIGKDVGISGGAASAEEAAVQVVDEDEENDADD